MASHANTPRSVLDAPTATQVVISEQTGFTRRERRRMTTVVDKTGDVDQLVPVFTKSRVPKAEQLPATNVPFRWDDKAAAERAIAAVSQVVLPEQRRTLSARMKSLMTFGAGRRLKSEQAHAASAKSARVLGRGRAGAR